MSYRRKRNRQHYPLGHCPFRIVLALFMMATLPALAAPPAVVWPDGEQRLLGGPDDSQFDIPRSGEDILAGMQDGALPDDPRLLGRALVTLRSLPSAGRDADSWWLQGRIEQRLHQFDNATVSLARASAMAPDNLTYLLEQFYVALASGDAAQAKIQCDRVTALQAIVLSASCNAQWQLQFGVATRALETIDRGLADAGRDTDRAALMDARITRAEILSRLGEKGATAAWLKVLSEAPDNDYARDQLARQLLEQARYANVERITRGRQALGLLVSRVIALRKMGDPQADALQQRLEREFRLARWRNDGLHRNEHVRFLLQVKGEKSAALALAREGWRADPTPENRRVLLQLASEMGKTALVATLIRDMPSDRPESREAKF